MAVLAVSACKDELEGDKVIGLPGHFTFAVSDNHNWGENTITRSGVEAPILMESTLEGGEPLYLHTTIEISPSVEMEQKAGNEDQPGTRGIRYTEDVFRLSSSSSPKISDFGVYGRTEDGSVTIFNFTQITPTATETKDGGVSYNWNVKYDDTMYQQWGSGQTSDFYGYAPYFDKDNNQNGLSMTLDNGVPILAYQVPTNVENQLDILTAKETGVSKSDATVVKLPFDHVMSAIKFSFKHGKGTSDNGATWSENGNYQWKYGDKTFNITVKSIHINNVYSKGTWRVGDNPYTATPGPYTESGKEGRWIIDSNDQGNATFTYNLTKELENESGATTELTPDNGGNVFMMVPQTVPDNATISLECEFENIANANDKRQATLTAPLKKWNFNASNESTTLVTENNQTVPMEWLPGYTYTYAISMSDVVFVFDLNEGQTHMSQETAWSRGIDKGGESVLPVGYYGTEEKDVFIRSYKIDSKGIKTNVDWWPEYEETQADAIGVGDGGADQTVWKKGTSGWIHVYDSISGKYDTEVETVHKGAQEGDLPIDKLFKIRVNTIMYPVKDLSMWNYDQTKRRRKRCTSNCYIVAGPGTYVIPLVYGNGITNGKVNTIAYNPGVSQNNAWPKFVNFAEQEIKSPYINKDLALNGEHQVQAATLIWAEGDAAEKPTDTNNMLALRQSRGSNYVQGTSETIEDRKARNEGAVIKVIPDIDTGVYDDDGYNLPGGETAGCNFLKFEVKPEHFNYGNAVVGVRYETAAGDNVVWSWHVWLVDPGWFIDNNTTLSLEGNEVTYANTNIGYVPGGKSVARETRIGHTRLVQKESGKIITIDAKQEKRRAFTTYFTNVLYQWGRKDPVRGNVHPDDMGTNYGAPRGPKGYRPFSNNMEDLNGGNASIFVRSHTATIGQMIRTPNTIYGQSDGDMYNYGSATPSNLWAATLQKYYITNGGTWLFHGKTIYDPSPVGYCVPPSKYLTKLRRGGFDPIGTDTQTDDELKQRGILCTYTANSDEGSGKTLEFQATGIRTTTGGYDLHSRGLHQPGAVNAANGFYHTATPFTDDENWQLHLYFYSGIDTHNFIRGDMCECLSVKPVLWDGEVDNLYEEDPTEQYLTFTFLEGGKGLYWVDAHTTSGQTSRTIQWTYTPDDESSWQNVTSSYDAANDETGNTHEGTRIANNLPRGTKIYVRGINPTYCVKNTDNLGVDHYYYNYFRATGSYELSGNIMSMTWGSDFKGKTAFQSGSTFTFCSLFYNPQVGQNTNRTLESVDGLVMPATSLVTSCYESLFEGCENLVTAPFLPATTGATNCYKNMFKDCTSLTTIKSSLESPSTSYTEGWVSSSTIGKTYGVAATGTFFYSRKAKSGNPAVTTWPTGVNGIPEGWASYDIY